MMLTWTRNNSILESADGAIMMFDVTNKQSFINLVSDENNSRQIKRSWMKELKFKAKGDKYPVMILGMPLHTQWYMKNLQ